MGMFAQKYGDRFAKQEPSEAFERLPYLPVGDHRLKLDVLREQSGMKGDFAIAEFTVVESNACDEGDRYVRMMDMSKPPAIGELKSLIGALVDGDPNDLDGEDLDTALGEDNPLADREVTCCAFGTTTKAGNPFTVCRWSAAS